MSEKTYLPNDEPLKSYSDINYLDLEQHQHIWKRIIDSHPFNQSVKIHKHELITITKLTYFASLLCFYRHAPLILLQNM
jgi:hypothetical protein